MHIPQLWAILPCNKRLYKKSLCKTCTVKTSIFCKKSEKFWKICKIFGKNLREIWKIWKICEIWKTWMLTLPVLDLPLSNREGFDLRNHWWIVYNSRRRCHSADSWCRIYVLLKSSQRPWSSHFSVIWTIPAALPDHTWYGRSHLCRAPKVS